MTEDLGTSTSVWLFAIGSTCLLLLALVVIYVVEYYNNRAWQTEFLSIADTFWALNPEKLDPDRIITTDGRISPPEFETTDMVVDDLNNVSAVFLFSVTASLSCTEADFLFANAQSLTVENSPAALYTFPGVRPQAGHQNNTDYVLVASTNPVVDTNIYWENAAAFKCYGQLSSVAAVATITLPTPVLLSNSNGVGSPVLTSAGSEGSFSAFEIAPDYWGLQVPRAGMYQLAWHLAYSVDGGGANSNWAWLERNATLPVVGNGTTLSTSEAPFSQSPAGVVSVQRTAQVRMAPGDYVSLVGFLSQFTTPPTITIHSWALEAVLIGD